MPNLYKKIIDDENIKEAYLEVYESLLKGGKVFKYDVIDAQQIHNTEINLSDFLDNVQKYLITAKKPRLANSVMIPKKNGKSRKIYMIPIRERVCCQAIYRVLQEYLKPNYSNYLYSFRSERPSYFALRSLRRFYLKHLKNESITRNTANKDKKRRYFVLKTDFKDYSDNINRHILLKQLEDMDIDSKTLTLIKQFIEIPFVRDGELQAMYYGTMQGLPLISLFNNIYTADIDREIGEMVEFYRRVGDDIIASDKDYDKLNKALEIIRKKCKQLKLPLNEEKTILCPLEEEFEYLGLAFKKGKIFIPIKKFKKIISDIKILLPAKSKISGINKLKRLKSVLVINGQGKSMLFDNYVKSLNLITDMAQLQEFSKRLMTVIWAYFGGGYSAKKLATGQKFLRESGIRVKSFFLHFKLLILSHKKNP